MTKAAICTQCSDIVAPYRAWQTDRRWRLCQCSQMMTRWQDGARGLIEVTAMGGPEQVRVLGLNNMFLGAAVDDGRTLAPVMDDAGWRGLHDACATVVETNYLFHKDRRACWALVVRIDASGDIIYVPWIDAWTYAPAEQSKDGP